MNLFAKVIKVSGWSFLLLEISENEQDTKRKKAPLIQILLQVFGHESMLFT